MPARPIPRRPRPAAAGGVVVLLVLGTTLAACTDEPDLSPDDRAACGELMGALPSSVAGLSASDAQDLTSSWGDPAITLRCGVGTPGDYDDISACTESAGVGWYIPPEQIDDTGADVTLYAMSHVPLVEIDIPADYRPEGPATVMADLGEAIASTLEEINPCR